jgi:hypothetical protein
MGAVSRQIRTRLELGKLFTEMPNEMLHLVLGCNEVIHANVEVSIFKYHKNQQKKDNCLNYIIISTH